MELLITIKFGNRTVVREILMVAQQGCQLEVCDRFIEVTLRTQSEDSITSQVLILTT
jgi:hypothetical protein